ncbi:MAG: transporter permease [Thermomicrobiales bacterium]|nr:transporter permease [Thermomicrobiales bacterium]
MTTAPMEREATGANRLSELARSIFSTVGILPILLAIVVLYFASQESRFYGTANLTNVLRQSTYLIIVTLGQALVLISGGFDLSVGAVIAVTSVVSARFMSNYYAANPNSELTSVLVGVGIGLLVGMVFGLVNGIGVARFKVSPFIMTLGMASVGSGFALYYTGGSPVSGMPPLFTREIGTGRWFEIPVPVYAAIVATILVLFLVGSTTWGRYLYAIGGNTKAAYLSGIPVGVYTASVYVMCGVEKDGSWGRSLARSSSPSSPMA